MTDDNRITHITVIQYYYNVMLNYHTPIYDSITFHLTNDEYNVH